MTKSSILQVWTLFSQISSLGFNFWVINELEFFCKKVGTFKGRGSILPDFIDEISLQGTCDGSLPPGSYQPHKPPPSVILDSRKEVESVKD